jgi:hypothetical protein
MTINYPDGTILKALLLSRDNDTLRASVPGHDDVRTFILNDRIWISEDGEPVNIEFAWQRREQVSVPSEAECVCSKELAFRLISGLRAATLGDGLIGKYAVCVLC